MAFIVFEGLDGSGKSTLIQNLKTYLEGSEKFDVCLTHEPGGTSLGEEIRHLLLRTTDESPTPLTELLLYQASRSQNVGKVIQPALKAKKWVLCDRYTASSVAFQCGGRGLSRELVDSLNEVATEGLSPDLWVLLDLSLEESLRRREHREETGEKNLDRFELEKQNFHKKVRESFLQQAQQQPDKWIILNAEVPPESVFQELIDKLRDKGWIRP